MPKRHLVSQLPSPLLRELEARLKKNGYSEFVSLSSWLNDKGYDISKSAIFNYSQKMRSAGETPPGEENQARDIDLRMRCLEVAVQLPDQTDIIETATPLFSWVTTGERS